MKYGACTPCVISNKKLTDLRRVAKGNRIVIPIAVVHRSKAIWGDDALEFKYAFVIHPYAASTNVAMS